METVFTWIQQNLVEIMATLTNILLGLQVLLGRKSTKTKTAEQLAEQAEAKRQVKLQRLLKKAEAIQAEYSRLEQAEMVTVAEVRNLHQMSKELDKAVENE